MRTTPWLTPDSIVFLESFIAMFPVCRILEFGCGGSTLWFAERGVMLTSIEHDAVWHNTVKKELATRKKSVDLRLLARPYDSVCGEFPDESFDLVLVDGRDRVRCVKAVHTKVKHKGVLMLDNSDRPEYAEALEVLVGWESHRTHIEGEGSGPWDTTWWVKP